MASVTYNGPKDRADPTNRLRIPGDGNRKDLVIRKGVATEVPDHHRAAVEALAEDHKLTFSDSPEVKFTSASAEESAEGLVLEPGQGSGSGGAYTVDDVKAAQEAAEGA